VAQLKLSHYRERLSAFAARLLALAGFRHTETRHVRFWQLRGAKAMAQIRARSLVRANVRFVTPKPAVRQLQSALDMNDIGRLFQAFLAPAIFISAASLLILSINVRLMGIVSRLRQFVHAKHDATRNDRVQEAEAYSTQIASIEKRAEIVRLSFQYSLMSLAATIASCMLLGLGLYFQTAAVAAVVVFVVGLICLFIGTVYYLREVMVALSSVRDEERDLHFMDLGRQPEVPQRDMM
jgi:hypothetical protein